MPPKKASKGASIIISNKAKIATAADNSTYIMYIIFNIKLLLNSRNNNKYVRRKELNPPYAGGTRLDADAAVNFCYFVTLLSFPEQNIQLYWHRQHSGEVSNKFHTQALPYKPHASVQKNLQALRNLAHNQSLFPLLVQRVILSPVSKFQLYFCIAE